MNESIWNSESWLPEFPRLTQNRNTDVLIIGGGLTGVLCAWLLQQAGMDYLLIEADRIGSGTTLKTTGKLTSQHGLIYHKLLKRFGPEKALLYWEANEAAISWYRSMAAMIPCDYEEKANYVFARQDAAAIAEEMTALEKLGIPCSHTMETELPFSVAGAIRFPGQGQFHPGKFLKGLLPGLKIYERTQAQAYNGESVVTSTGEVRARYIVVASHFPIWNKHGMYPLKLYQQRSYLTAWEGAMHLNGMYLGQEKDGLTFRACGDLLLVGGGAHRTGKRGMGWKVPEDFVQVHWPKAKLQYRWAAQDCMSLDGIPYIGRYAQSLPNVYTATGFNKWGMTTAFIAASILTDHLLGRSNPYADVFLPKRSVLLPQTAVNTVETAVNLLTFRKPRCPHLGCALKWNPWEHSWDCSCHGSRFDKDGKLLENPANGNLTMDSDTKHQQ